MTDEPAESAPPTAPTLRRRIFDVLEPGDEPSVLAQLVAALVSTLIVVSLALVAIGSTELEEHERRVILLLEIGALSVFTIEYLLRLWTAAENPALRAGRSATAARLRWMFTPLALIDLLAILPLLLVVALASAGMDLSALRALRLLRLLRVAKLGRYSRGIQALGRAAHQRRGELFSAVLVLGVLLFLAATLLYFVERDVQPEFSSIPKSMWWAVATLTTVGYGDVVPETSLGRVLGSLIAVLGIGVFALPAGILSAALHEEITRDREAREARRKHVHELGHCPHCGGDLSQPPAARQAQSDSSS